ncbi:MAG TPA: VWA domain-containing protein [Herpetosiphonaceae bacterium]
MDYRRIVLIGLLLLPLLAACGQGGVTGTGGQPTSAAPAGAVTLRMLYGSEKQSWIAEATAAFNQAGIKTAAGQPIFVEAVPLGSGESLEAIASGAQQADIWSPASSIYLPLGNAAWAKNGNAGPLLDAAAAPPLVLSPVVIAMWKPMAQALGWPDKQIGWSDLAALATSGKTWADYGHREWGAFQFGHTHPDYSNSGLATIIALAYAGAKKTEGLSAADVQGPGAAALISGVEQSVIHYGASTGFFATKMFDEGPGYLSAAVLYENLVIESYDQALHPNVDFPVVALYPAEGSFWSDHPFAILNTPGMTDEKRAAAALYRDYLLAPERQQAALKFGFRPANLNVPLAAPLDAAHGVDPTQLTVALPVPPTEVIEAVRATWQQNKKQVDVAVVIDTSGSMRQEGRLKNAKDALIGFLAAFADQDRLGVTSFGSAAAELSPLTPLGPKRGELQGRIENLIADGNTRLYNTVAEAYAALSAEPAGQRIRALVVLSDGEDTADDMTIDQLLDVVGADAEGTSIKVFTIAYGSDAQLDVLERIAEATGARAFAGDPATIKQVYAEIATFF